MGRGEDRKGRGKETYGERGGDKEDRGEGTDEGEG